MTKHAGKKVKIQYLKVGEAFTFHPGSVVVYVRARGGFRPGRGGKLYILSEFKDMYVFRYNQ